MEHRHGWAELWVHSTLLMIAWAMLFYLLSATFPCWIKHTAASLRAHENDRYWCARCWLGVVHATIISIIAVPGFLMLAFVAPSEVQVYFSSDIAHCSIAVADYNDWHWDQLYRTIAWAGLAFTTFAIVDIIVSFIHGLATKDFVVHHIAFIVCGVIIRGNCMMLYNSTVLMAMEASTPFLNIMLFYRNRGSQYGMRVASCGAIFFVLFVIFRLVINTYGAVYLWIFHKTVIPNVVPSWQVGFLLVAISMGAALQFFWFPKILKLFLARIRGLLRGESATSEWEEQLDALQVELVSVSSIGGQAGSRRSSLASTPVGSRRPSLEPISDDPTSSQSSELAHSELTAVDPIPAMPDPVVLFTNEAAHSPRESQHPNIVAD